MPRNLFSQFRSLLPQTPLLVGTVVSVTSGVATVELPGGGRLQARGSATAGQKVFVRDHLIEGIAPNLTPEILEV
jgi:hypothetical protein